ncbi:septum formation family protein [Nocardia sp. CNY236]|uniref:septum formation family protein n=1 Tax=Nocardia sp. CNY236 TaxID=1169152 RepID=UPI0004225CEC|nr:septum formation family protein [Nocardia sp. CNY236]
MSSEDATRPRRTPKRRGATRAEALRRSFGSADLQLSASTLRWGLTAVAVGAVAAALVTLFVTGFDNEKGLEAHSPGSPLQPILDKEFGTAATGDCLSWTEADRSDLVKVNCESTHLFEVAADIDMSGYPGKEFGPGSRFPDSLRLAELKEEHCVPAVQKYMSGRFDPHGRYTIGLMYPSQVGWQHGDRTLRCGLQVTATVGMPPSAGSATEQDQSKVYGPGVCLGSNQNLPTDPVDCAQPHAVEIVSTLDLGTRFGGGPPSKEEQDTFAAQECKRTSTDYLGGPDVIRDKTLTLFADYIDARSWLAGSRKVDCMIGKGTGREGFAPIVGSATGDILIDGHAPIPPPKNGRSTPTPLPGAAPLPPQPR